jgi:prepilin-type N-terminal cleavage/methylation domain-containing protein
MTVQTATEGDRSTALQRKRTTMCVKKTITRFRAGAQEASSTAWEQSAKRFDYWRLFLNYDRLFQVLHCCIMSYTIWTASTASQGLIGPLRAAGNDMKKPTGARSATGWSLTGLIGPVRAVWGGMKTSFRARSAAGFSLTEMLTVVVMIGVIMLFALPRAGVVLDRTQVGGARTTVVNQFNTARMAARSSNRTTVFRLANNVIYVERRPFTGTVKDPVGNPQDLSQIYGVQVTGPDSIVVDARGMVVYFSSGASAQYVVTRAGITDSVVINSSGRVIR